MVDPYAVLGVARDAPVSEIRRAYVTLARSTHPDVRADDPDAAERMRRINRAWEMLSDADSRAAVDRRLNQQPRPGPGPQGTATWGSTAHSQEQDFDADRHFEAYDFEAARDDFDGDDRPLSAGDLPDWMRLGAPLGFVLGIFAVIFGVLAGGFVLVRLGLLSLGLSVLLFMLSPFVVLVRSRGRPSR